MLALIVIILVVINTISPRIQHMMLNLENKEKLAIQGGRNKKVCYKRKVLL